MSRRHNPYDNAKTERFMKTVKAVYLRDDDEDVIDLPRFLDEVCNHRRLHFALGSTRSGAA
jgi:transposase InsO family protein